MFETYPDLWLIPGLPLAAAVLTAFFGPRWLKGQSHWPCILAIAASCMLSVGVLGCVAHQPEGYGLLRNYYTWFKAGNADVGFTLRADALTAVMLVTVTFVGSFIAIFAVGYMSHEREHNAGYARFFAEVALFIFSMTGLVLADNYIVLYAFWEGVGLCSYLLVGFWFEKPAAAAAARKAFLVTRIGDVGMIIGIILIWTRFRAAALRFTRSTSRRCSRRPVPRPGARRRRLPAAFLRRRRQVGASSPSTSGCRTRWRAPPPSAPSSTPPRW